MSSTVPVGDGEGSGVSDGCVGATPVAGVSVGGWAEVGVKVGLKVAAVVGEGVEVAALPHPARRSTRARRINAACKGRTLEPGMLNRFIGSSVPEVRVSCAAL